MRALYPRSGALAPRGQGAWAGAPRLAPAARVLVIRRGAGAGVGDDQGGAADPAVLRGTALVSGGGRGDDDLIRAGAGRLAPGQPWEGSGTARSTLLTLRAAAGGSVSGPIRSAQDQ